jgi:hypothetical protein
MLLTWLRQRVNLKSKALPRGRLSGTSCRPQVEQLEDRLVPAPITAEFPVSTGAINDYESANASSWSQAGRAVAVWTDQWGGADTDIRAQRYDANHMPFGGWLWVASTTLPEHEPSVATDYDGNNFVVTWTEDNALGQDIKVARYDFNTGNQIGMTLTLTGPGGVEVHKQHESHIAMDPFGNFVISYTYDYSTFDKDVYFNQGNLTNGITVGGPVAVAVSGWPEYHSSVTKDFAGDFAIAY